MLLLLELEDALLEKPLGNVLLLEFRLNRELEFSSAIVLRSDNLRVPILAGILFAFILFVRGGRLSVVSCSLSCSYNIWRVVLVSGIFGAEGFRLIVPCCENSDSKPCSVEGVETLER